MSDTRPNLTVVRAAAKALGQILKDAKPDKEIDEMTAALIGAFKDAYPDVRREAVRACGMIGQAAKACIPNLMPLRPKWKMSSIASLIMCTM